MKLNELLNMFDDGAELDTSDNIFDSGMTIYWDKDEEEDEDYPHLLRLKRQLAEKVDVVKITKGFVFVVGYTDLIERNFDLFKDFALANWDWIPDDEELAYQFIQEFEKLLAGYGTESIYRSYFDLLEKCR